MAVDTVKATIRNYFSGTKQGRLTTFDGESYSFTLDDIKDDALLQELSVGWEPGRDIPVSLVIYRSDSSIIIANITKAKVHRSTAAPPSGLPASSGPYRDAKECLLAHNDLQAEEKFKEAIRTDDRKSSAVKDLASMLNAQGRSHDAMALVDAFLLVTQLGSVEKTSFVNLRENIRQKAARLAPGPAASSFAEQIRSILQPLPPSAQQSQSTHPEEPPVLGCEELACRIASLQKRLHKPATPLGKSEYGRLKADLVKLEQEQAELVQAMSAVHAALSPDLRIEFLGVLQDGKYFPRLPWSSLSNPQAITLPQDHFNNQQPWAMARATLLCGQNRQPLANSKPVTMERLPAPWLLKICRNSWLRELTIPQKLAEGEQVYFLDEQILAGPWKVSLSGTLEAVHEDYVKEWPWDSNWRQIEFEDRAILLDVPQEAAGERYVDLASDTDLLKWLEKKLAMASRQIVPASMEPVVCGLAALTSSLDASRWSRLEGIVMQASAPVSDEAHASLPVQEPVQLPGHSPAFVETVLAQFFPTAGLEVSQTLHLGTLACRCLVVPSPLHSQIYSQCLGAEAVFLLVSPSVSWLSFRDAWNEIEWVWNAAHADPSRLYLLHFEEANLSMLQYWVKPLLNVAQGLTNLICGFTDLPWPPNLRTHWSLSTDPEAFPLKRSLCGAFGALDPESPAPTGMGQSMMAADNAGLWMEWSQGIAPPCPTLGANLHDYTYGASAELGRLQLLAEGHQWPPELARRIRLEFPGRYWERSENGQVSPAPSITEIDLERMQTKLDELGMSVRDVFARLPHTIGEEVGTQLEPLNTRLQQSNDLVKELYTALTDLGEPVSQPPTPTETVSQPLPDGVAQQIIGFISTLQSRGKSADGVASLIAKFYKQQGMTWTQEQIYSVLHQYNKVDKEGNIC